MNTYGFLYFKTRGARGGERYRVFKGRDSDEAARKMARFLVRLRCAFEAWANPEVDYDVDVNPGSQKPRTQQDLYLLGERHPIYEFLP